MEKQKIYASHEVKTVRAFYQDLIRDFPPKGKIIDWLTDMTEHFWRAYQMADPHITVQVSNFHPPLIGASKESIFAAALSRSDFEAIILAEYGYISWQEIKEKKSFDEVFERAVDCVVRGRVFELGQLLDQNPGLIDQKSQFGHEASLIHYVAANGVELWRQLVPANAAEILKLLLVKGANPGPNNRLMGGTSLLSLIETSEHLMMAGISDELLEILEAYG
ncbi:MAG: hypothetical protein OEY56_15170 [Cyclobacteriaceae bacterium]|nr:hypothetical protein [Cyclobacteriaceae bacterium]